VEPADFRGLEMREVPVPPRVHPQEARLQDLQRIAVRDKEDVPAGIPPLQRADERGRPGKHGAHRLDVTVGVVGVRLVRRPHDGVVISRRALPVTEAPFPQRLGDRDGSRSQRRGDDPGRLLGAREV
jgi:hypothetical protein